MGIIFSLCLSIFSLSISLSLCVAIVVAAVAVVFPFARLLRTSTCSVSPSFSRRVFLSPCLLVCVDVFVQGRRRG
ncbi:hypothetical protein DFJ73DRAFT_848328 [Zopfochytrium polystomum]|nr:hypothetical protein DFJ73DRAFT_848328 [Zopfochytrium polystomum]